ncbi:hypothetical protein KP509_03G054500 [Ceratopteris richardii]|uniref:Uncharacterized protein n=1 Tax=Ceratopteris richardii TaxID=49495 RepID=A0A8T2VBM5_CERRI|nr:hypothetical protein KP509_03G054500 [Ceratopteris richardii]
METNLAFGNNGGGSERLEADADSASEKLKTPLPRFDTAMRPEVQVKPAHAYSARHEMVGPREAFGFNGSSKLTSGVEAVEAMADLPKRRSMCSKLRNVYRKLRRRVSFRTSTGERSSPSPS